MKNLALVLVTAFAMNVFADTPLENIMGGMSKDMRVISKQINDPKQNASTLAAVRDLQALIKQGENEVPKAVAGTPNEAAQVAEYKKQMGALLVLAQQMEEALVNNDNAKASAILAQMGEAKKQGHDQFKKD